VPELPEVEMARRYLQAISLHRTILSARVLDGRILAGVTASRLEQALTGRQFDCALRHGTISGEHAW